MAVNQSAITAAESAAQSYVSPPGDFGSKGDWASAADLASARAADASTDPQGTLAETLMGAKDATADPLTPNYAATLGELSPGVPIPAWGTGYGYLPVGFSEGKCLGDAQSMGSFSWDGHAQA
jgi:hypothetical protein